MEVKFVGGLGRRRPTSRIPMENVGKILSDLFRLKLYANGGRYLLIVSEGRPEQHVAFNRQDDEERSYLRGMLEVGEGVISIDLGREPDTVRSYVSEFREAGIDEVNEVHLLRLAIKPLETRTEPDGSGSGSAYHFHLLRLLPLCKEETQ